MMETLKPLCVTKTITTDVSTLHVHKGEAVTVWLHGDCGMVQVELHVDTRGQARIVTDSKDQNKFAYTFFDQLYI